MPASAFADNSVAARSDKDHGFADTIFGEPGTLEMCCARIHVPLLANAHLYDLSAFSARVVSNNEPFYVLDAHSLAQKTARAQSPLRVVTYNYGPGYVSQYLMPGSGVFLEKHAFAQSITAAQPSCGGFVLLARAREDELELVAVEMVFGYTLVLFPWCIHGDSALVGLYMVAIPSSRRQTGTADTVFLKHKGNNTEVHVVPVSR